MRVHKMIESDYKSIDRWLKLRRLKLKSEQFSLGFIVKGVCAAQLIKCENGTAIFDSLVSNPMVSSTARHSGIDSLVSAVLREAHILGYKRIVAFTEDEGTLERAKRRGFTPQNHTVITYSINEDN